MLGRLLVAGLALVCLAVGGLALRDDRRCSDTVTTASTTNTSPALGRRLADDVLDLCASTRDALVVAVVLRARGDDDAARAIGRGLVRRAPDDYAAWLAVARLESDPARARAAFARARALNPLGTPPAR